MKLWLRYLAIASCALTLQGCGGGTSLGDSKLDTDNLQPLPPEDIPDNRPRPTATIPVITAKKGEGIRDAYGAPLLMRGVNIKFNEDPVTGVDAIIAAKAAGSNVVRILIDENVTDPQLEGALVKVIENNMVAIVSFTGPKVNCVTDDAYLIESTTKLWRTKWMEVLAEDRFQSNIMINIADGWGPSDIFSPTSSGYDGYVDTYKALIRKFRDDGFKVPLVIDAPSCGEDFNAFLANRGRELLAADQESNLILSVQANGEKWNTEGKLLNAVASLNDETVPYIFTSFKGSDVGDAPVDHLVIMKETAGDNALAVNFPWTVGGGDVGAFTTMLPEATDLRGGAAVSVNAFIATPYFEYKQDVGSSNVIAHGKLEVALYAKDINGNRLKLGSEKVTNLRPNFWNPMRFEIPQTAIDTAMLMAGATSFDITKVTEVGVQLLSHDQVAASKGNILFDDLQIWPGVPPMYESDFSVDTNGWSLGWGGGTVTYQDAALALTPNGMGGDFSVQFANANKLKFSTTLDVTIHMYIPATYTETIKVHFYAMFGDAWQWTETSADVSGLKAGEWGDVKAVLRFSDDPNVANLLDKPQALGFLLGDFTVAHSEPVLVDKVTISDRFGKKMKTVIATQFKSTFTKNVEDFAPLTWNDVAVTTIEASNGELVITPQVGTATRAGISKGNIHSINEIDLKGPVVVKMKVFVPATYSGTTFPISLFIQDGTDWTWHETAQKSPDNFVPGEWATVEFNFDDLPSDFDRGPVPNAFGILFYGTTGLNGSSFKIDDVEFIGATLVDDSEPVLSLDFTMLSDLDLFKFDSAASAGTLTESVFVTAKKLGYKVPPLGWMANAWAGNKGDQAPLNIAVSQDVKDLENITYVLTPRGEEIVNGMYGIKATSVEITPTPVKPK